MTIRAWRHRSYSSARTYLRRSPVDSAITPPVACGPAPQPDARSTAPRPSTPDRAQLVDRRIRRHDLVGGVGGCLLEEARPHAHARVDADNDGESALVARVPPLVRPPGGVEPMRALRDVPRSVERGPHEDRPSISQGIGQPVAVEVRREVCAAGEVGDRPRIRPRRTRPRRPVVLRPCLCRTTSPRSAIGKSVPYHAPPWLRNQGTSGARRLTRAKRSMALALSPASKLPRRQSS